MDVWWLCLAFVFVYAALARAASPKQRADEEDRFGLPRGAGWLIVAFELWLAWGLAHRDRTVAKISVAFIAGATLLILARHPRQIWESREEAGCYHASLMSVALHVSYILLVTKMLACA